MRHSLLSYHTDCTLGPIMLKWQFKHACPVRMPITSLSVCRGNLNRSLSHVCMLVAVLVHLLQCSRFSAGGLLIITSTLLLLLCTQMETSALNTYHSLKGVIDYQTHHKLRESQGRSFAEDLNERVQYWSVGQTVIILVTGIGQVLILRSFFSERKTIHASNTRT